MHLGRKNTEYMSYHYIPNKKRYTYSDFFPVQFTFLDSCNLINKILPTCWFVMKLLYDINEYPYLYLAWKSWDSFNR